MQHFSKLMFLPLEHPPPTMSEARLGMETWHPAYSSRKSLIRNKTPSKQSAFFKMNLKTSIWGNPHFNNRIAHRLAWVSCQIKESLPISKHMVESNRPKDHLLAERKQVSRKPCHGCPHFLLSTWHFFSSSLSCWLGISPAERKVSFHFYSG